MSLLIDTDKIHEVLLSDGWHPVDIGEDGLSTFDLDAYEFGTFKSIGENQKEFRCIHYGGADGMCATGATWTEDGQTINTPLNQVIAVKMHGGN